MTFSESLKTYQFVEPTQWVCHVIRYLEGHRELTIVASRMESAELLIMGFVGVEYFEGPPVWRGADFRVEPHEECVSFLERLGVPPFAHILETVKLFTVSNMSAHDPDMRVKIIAATGSVTDKGIEAYKYR